LVLKSIADTLEVHEIALEKQLPRVQGFARPPANTPAYVHFKGAANEFKN